MKGSAFLHLPWAGIALGTFFLGATIFDKKSNPNPSVNPQTSGTRSLSSDRNTGSPANSSSFLKENGATREHEPLSKSDIQSLGESLREANDSIYRQIAFAKILAALTPQNALLLREQIAHLPQKSPEFRDFHYAWGRIAGEDALVIAKDSPERDLAAVLAGWANANPEAALAYFDGLSPDDTSEYYLLPTGLANGLADNHPELAIDFVKTRLKDDDRYTVKLLNSVVDSLIQNHPPEKLAELTKQVPKGDLLNSISYKVVQHLSDSDPAQAYLWASSLPNGKAKYQGIGASFARWAGKDPVAAARWLSTSGLSQEQKDQMLAKAKR